jgi:putative nucleotidyltransferase with HDIG domain
LATANRLPSFPRAIQGILATLDDPAASARILEQFVRSDPAVAARILYLANSAAAHGGRPDRITGLPFAVSLIGHRKVRELVMLSSVYGFVHALAERQAGQWLWSHGLAVSICCEEVSRHVAASPSGGSALIAGLLHDVGQLWLMRFEADAFAEVQTVARNEAVSIHLPEREAFGHDHATLGAWLAESWLLPDAIVKAIQYHHCPDAALDEPLVPIVHVAEVLSHALDLSQSESRVGYLSAGACAKLDLAWNEDCQHLFGRIEGRSRHANALLWAA